MDPERGHDQEHGCSYRLYILHFSPTVVLGLKILWKVGTIPSGQRL
jgi:hypothetical protein